MGAKVQRTERGRRELRFELRDDGYQGNLCVSYPTRRVRRGALAMFLQSDINNNLVIQNAIYDRPFLSAGL